MTLRRYHSVSLLVSALGCVAALSGCTRTESRQVVENQGEPAAGYPQRLDLAGMAQPVDVAPVQPEGSVWRVAGAAVEFGVPGQPALFALSCGHAADGTALIKVMRETRAESGAKALFALIGNGRIARLPLDVTRAGEPGQWAGNIPARDTRLEVLKGGNRIEATLPGGGTLKLPASSEPGRLLNECRASDRGPADAAA